MFACLDVNVDPPNLHSAFQTQCSVAGQQNELPGCCHSSAADTTKQLPLVCWSALLLLLLLHRTLHSATLHLQLIVKFKAGATKVQKGKALGKGNAAEKRQLRGDKETGDISPSK
jgi:hypothetical protein